MSSKPGEPGELRSAWLLCSSWDCLAHANLPCYLTLPYLYSRAAIAHGEDSEGGMYVLRTDYGESRGEATAEATTTGGVLPFFHSSRHMKGRTKGPQLKYLSHWSRDFGFFDCCPLRTSFGRQDGGYRHPAPCPIAGERAFPRRVYFVCASVLCKSRNCEHNRYDIGS